MICYECKKLGHLRNEYPPLRKDSRKARRKKAMMATKEDLENDSFDSDERTSKLQTFLLHANGRGRGSIF